MPPLPQRSPSRNGAAAPITEEPPERLALNLADLDAFNQSSPALCARLFGGKLALAQVLQVNREKPTEVAVPFLCGLLTAALACDLARSEARRRESVPLRVYLLVGGRWQQLRQSAVLTELSESGKPQLNPEIFRSQMQPLVITLPQRDRVEL